MHDPEDQEEKVNQSVDSVIRQKNIHFTVKKVEVYSQSSPWCSKKGLHC